MQTEEKRQQIPNSIGRAVFVALSFLLQVGWILGFALYLTRYYAIVQLAASLLALLLPGCTADDDLVPATPGDTATLTVSRSGQTQTLTITFDERTDERVAASQELQEQIEQEQSQQYSQQYGNSYGGGYWPFGW